MIHRRGSASPLRFEPAAFCDTFGGPSKVPGRGRELDAIFCSRMLGQLSKTHARGIGMANIPECRPDLPSKVWPDQDSLICNPTFDLMSLRSRSTSLVSFKLGPLRDRQLVSRRRLRAGDGQRHVLVVDKVRKRAQAARFRTTSGGGKRGKHG